MAKHNFKFKSDAYLERRQQDKNRKDKRPRDRRSAEENISR